MVSELGRNGTNLDWTFLSNHANVLLCIAEEPEIRLREVAARVGITERAVQRIVADLEEGGYLSRRQGPPQSIRPASGSTVAPPGSRAPRRQPAALFDPRPCASQPTRPREGRRRSFRTTTRLNDATGAWLAKRLRSGLFRGNQIPAAAGLLASSLKKTRGKSTKKASDHASEETAGGFRRSQAYAVTHRAPTAASTRLEGPGVEEVSST